MSYCDKCGNILESNDIFCAKCGSKIETKENIIQDDSEKSTQHFQKVHTISKKEYFATKCSKKAKVLIGISWAVWILNIISVIVGIYISLFRSYGKTIIGDQTITYTALDIIKSAKDSGFIDIGLIFFGISIIINVSALIFAFFSQKMHNMFFATCYLIFSIFPIMMTSLYNIICAIIIVVVMCIINREYKKYIYGLINPKGECHYEKIEE